MEFWEDTVNDLNDPRTWNHLPDSTTYDCYRATSETCRKELLALPQVIRNAVISNIGTKLGNAQRISEPTNLSKEKIIELMEDSDEIIRKMAVEALSFCQEPGVMDHLIMAFHDESYLVKSSVIMGLANFSQNDDVANYLLSIASDTGVDDVHNRLSVESLQPDFRCVFG